MRPRQRMLWGMGMFALVLANGCAVNRPVRVETSTQVTGEKPNTLSPAGMTVHVDPVTGKFGGVPPLVDVPQTTPGRSVEAPPQLVEVPSSVPGGGVMIDLQGQFETPLVATVGEDGKVRLRHEAEPLTDATRE